jgi:hypothetical protein
MMKSLGKTDMGYSDKYGSFFGRALPNGDIAVLHAEEGEPATRLDAAVYPVGADVSARYEHPAGIVLTRADASAIGIEIEEG